MFYCSRHAIQSRLPEIRNAGASENLDAQVEEAIKEAQVEIDSALGFYYPVPFCPVPPLVRSIASYLAAAFLLDSGLSGSAEPTKLAEHYRDLARKRLADIVEGRLSLDPSAQDGSSPGFHADHSGQEPTLARFNPYAV